MSLISMMEARLPPGFRFHPRDDELVLDYLCHKLSGSGGGSGAYGGVAIVDVDLNKCEPWDLPDEACVGGREWCFFSLRDRKYATGQRTNRATQSGYWKATGKDRAIISRRGGGGGAVVGMRKTLVFYQGRAPKGTKTEWVMYEFRVEDQAVAVADHPASCLPSLKEDWVLCRVFCKGRTTTPRSASDEASSLFGDPSVASVLLPMAPMDEAYAAIGQAPIATIDGYYYEQQDSGFPATHHWPVMPFQSFRELLSSMVEGSGDPMSAFPQGWSVEGYTQQSGVPQTWNPF